MGFKGSSGFFGVRASYKNRKKQPGKNDAVVAGIALLGQFYPRPYKCIARISMWRMKAYNNVVDLTMWCGRNWHLNIIRHILPYQTVKDDILTLWLLSSLGQVLCVFRVGGVFPRELRDIVTADIGWEEACQNFGVVFSFYCCCFEWKMGSSKIILTWEKVSFGVVLSFSQIMSQAFTLPPHPLKSHRKPVLG